LIADFETGEENDNICNGRCDWKVGESKVSDYPLLGLWVWILIFAFAE